MPDRPWVLAALPPISPEDVRGFLGDLPVQVVTPPTRDEAGLHAALAGADLVLGDWHAQLKLDAAAFEAAPHLAFVQQPSVGVEHIDLDAAAAHGVPVANTAGSNAVSVAEWCVGATFAVLRSLAWADAELRAGRWQQLRMTARGSAELTGRRVGLVGFGPLGVECAKRYAGLGCPVSYWSRRRRAPVEEHGATYREIDDLVATSDVLVVVVALGPETRGLLDAERLARLPAGAVVVNAARGGIVDEAAVLRAVDEGRLLGAAFDVYETEPLPADSPLRGSDRILLSPHAGGTTVQAIRNLATRCRANLARAVAGEPVECVVNGADPLVRRRR